VMVVTVVEVLKMVGVGVIAQPIGEDRQKYIL
jgi:hypothetical protein